MILPVDFTNRMKEYLSDEYDAFIASYDKPEVKGLRLNANAPRDILGAVCRKKKECDGENDIPAESTNPFEPVKWCENGYSYFSDEIRPGKHPYHESGAYYIQEPSAMSPVCYLSVEPGDRVLDLCAAPGGKSTQIGAKLLGDGILVTNEIMPDRARILSENIERMGIKNALVISEDPRNISDRFASYFDKILVDAPCSGEGMFRRSEVAVSEWSLDNVTLCANRQSWILDEAAKMLTDGGTLVYSTCTFAKEEDEEQIKAFLERHPEFELAEMEAYPGMRRGYDGIGIRLWPHLLNGEGHYLCKLVKRNALGELGNTSEKKVKNPSAYGYETGITEKDKTELKEMFDFFKDNIINPDYLKKKKLIRFKDQIYMLPDDCPSLKGMKVLRPGLHLGTMLKKRFEPSHALARVLTKEEVKNICTLTKNDVEVTKYFNGETFNQQLKNGWYVIYVDEFAMGWGKIANEIVKNHYPKGLRKNLNL